MKIGIDANPLMRNRGGVGWHMYHLLQALVGLKEDLAFVCYVDRGSLRRHEAEIREQWNGNPALKWIEGGRLMRRWRGAIDGLDLYHGMNFRLRTTGRYGAIVTIHDVWLDRNPHLSPKLFGQRRSFVRTKRMAERAVKVITVSEHSAQDIVEVYGIPREKIAVIHNGVSQDFRPMSDPIALAELRDRLLIPTERFILFAGGADPRKNHHTLVRAYSRCAPLLSSHSLVMVGDATNRFGDIRETARTFDVENRIVCTGPLSLDRLRLLYSHADVFVFPSLYEGFGMPVLEAMACGTPVITSRTTSLPEVAGDAAVLVNPEDAEELADAIMRVLDDPSLQSQLRALGVERAKQFTWQRAAQQTLAVYRAVVKENG
jgi:glycosyltransferase involved in cell wall biosynthesis